MKHVVLLENKLGESCAWARAPATAQLARAPTRRPMFTFFPIRECAKSIIRPHSNQRPVQRAGSFNHGAAQFAGSIDLRQQHSLGPRTAEEW
jgi:hypothetical protein